MSKSLMGTITVMASLAQFKTLKLCYYVTYLSRPSQIGHQHEMNIDGMLLPTFL